MLVTRTTVPPRLQRLLLLPLLLLLQRLLLALVKVNTCYNTAVLLPIDEHWLLHACIKSVASSRSVRGLRYPFSLLT